MKKNITRRKPVGNVKVRESLRTVFAGAREIGAVIEVFHQLVNGEVTTYFWRCSLIEEACERGHANHGLTSVLYTRGRDEEPGMYTLIFKPRNGASFKALMDEELVEKARCKAHLMFEEIRDEVAETELEERLPDKVAPEDRIAVSDETVDDLKAKFAAKFGKERKTRKDDTEREKRGRKIAKKQEARAEKKPEPKSEPEPKQADEKRLPPKIHAPNCDMCLLDKDGMWRDVFFADGHLGPALLIFDFEDRGTRKKVVVPVRTLGKVFSRDRIATDHVVLTYSSRKGCKGNVVIKAKPLKIGEEMLSNGFTLMPLDEESLDSIVDSCKATIKADKAEAAMTLELQKAEVKVKDAEDKRRKAEAAVKDAKVECCEAKEQQKRINKRRKKNRADKAKADGKPALKAKTKQPPPPPVKKIERPLREKKSPPPAKAKPSAGSGRASRTKPPAPVFHRHNMTYEERLADQREEGRRMEGLNR